jgi:hypothetical protein
MEPELYEGGLSPEPRRRRKHRHKERHRRLRRQQAWKRTLAALSLLALSLVLGGAAIGAALYFSKTPQPSQQGVTDGEETKGSTGDERLVGSWFSDPDLTIDELRQKERMSEQKELEYRRKRAQTILTFSATDLTIQIHTGATTQPFSVVRTDKDSIVLKTWFKALNKDEEVKLTFIAPEVLKFDAPHLGLVDYFRKIKLPVKADTGGEEKPAAEKEKPSADSPDK